MANDKLLEKENPALAMILNNLEGQMELSEDGVIKEAEIPKNEGLKSADTAKKNKSSINNTLENQATQTEKTDKRKKDPEELRSVKLPLAMTEKLYKALDEAAWSNRVSKNEFIIKVLEKELYKE